MFGEEDNEGSNDDTSEASTDNYISSLSFDPKVSLDAEVHLTRSG